ATALVLNSLPGGLFLYLPAAVAIIAGLVGLGMQHHREQRQDVEGEDETSSPPRVPPPNACRTEQPPPGRLARALTVLKLLSDDSHWEPDLSVYEEHHNRAEERLKAGDLTDAFREYCRAMLPLSKALSRHRKKEEVFQPIWDKNPESARRKIDPGLF